MTVRYAIFHYLLTEEWVEQLLRTRSVYALSGEPLGTVAEVRAAKQRDGVVESRERVVSR